MADVTTSQQLYQYLCEKIGTEEVVKARRTFFKVNDFLNNYTHSTIDFIFSGSKAEGLDLPGSDVDLMLMEKKYAIKSERELSRATCNEFIVDTSSTPPGFAHIKVHSPQHELNNYIIINGIQIEVELTRIENELILPNTPFKHFLKHNLIDAVLPNYITHGPSTSFHNESVDFVFCFRLDEWPREALNWISRTRLQDWPAEDLIADIVQDEKSALLVPIGSKFGSSKDNPCEWRISFSVAEQMLIHNFNHTQILCYAMLKILLKQVLDKEYKNLLCSYFMKTLLFWLIEETGFDMWTPCNLLKCFKACIARLSYHIKYEFFPNYFILQNNMFEGKKWADSQQGLLSLLLNVYTEGINFTLKTETLQDFITLKTNNQILNKTTIKYHNKDKAIYPLLQYLLPSLHVLSFRSFTTIYHYLTKCKSSLVKSLLFMNFAIRCINMATETKYSINRTNKHCYQEYKSLLPYFVLGTNINLNGWLPLAAFFYQHKQFLNTIKITDFVCYEITNKKNIIHNPDIQFCNTQSYKYTACKGSSFLQRYKSLCISHVIVEVQAGTVFDNCDFKIDTFLHSYFPVCMFDESICKLGHFMRFMCFHHLHDITRRHRALRDLQHVVDNTNITHQTSHFMMFALAPLNVAYKISNIQIPRRNFMKFIELCKSWLDIPVLHSTAVSGLEMFDNF